ncbi:MAG: hypothetical protein VB071_15150 [Lawsonibacter sp.]|nr:hypothetical protein [Lawsonibacter sp.]
MAEIIYYTLKDDVSSGLLTIRDKTVLLDKATQELERKYQSLRGELEKLTKKQRAWEDALTDSEKKSKKAKDAYEKFAEAAGGEQNDTAIKRQQELQAELEKTQESLKQTKELMRELGKEGEKSIAGTGSTDSAKSTAGVKDSSESQSLFGTLKDAGTFDPLVSSVGGAVKTGLSSALGEQNGSMAFSAISGLASGAASGAALGVPGMAIGGLVGLVSGAISGYTEKFEAEDAAFKKYYAGLYDTVSQATKTAIQSGSALAANRETQEATAKAEQMRQDGASEEDIAAVLQGTFQSISDKLELTKSGITEHSGEGYNNVREAGLQAEQTAYEGPLGAAMGHLGEIAGSNQAYLDNLSEQYTREALSAVLLGEDTSVYDEGTAATLSKMGEEYAALNDAYANGDQEAGLKMESLKETAEAMATAAYESSDQYQAVVDTEKDQIDAIRDNTAALDGWINEYELDQEKTKGQGGVDTKTTSSGNRSGQNRANESDDDGKDAFGLKRVPFNGYRAILHEGERVLTAAEAREQNSGLTLSVQFGDVTVRGERDMDEIAQRIVHEIERARLRAG